MGVIPHGDRGGVERKVFLFLLCISFAFFAVLFLAALFACDEGSKRMVHTGDYPYWGTLLKGDLRWRPLTLDPPSRHPPVEHVVEHPEIVKVCNRHFR